MITNNNQGGSATMAVDVLISRGVPESRILFLNLIASPEGIDGFAKRFPKLRVVTAFIDQVSLPVLREDKGRMLIICRVLMRRTISCLVLVTLVTDFIPCEGFPGWEVNYLPVYQHRDGSILHSGNMMLYVYYIALSIKAPVNRIIDVQNIHCIAFFEPICIFEFCEKIQVLFPQFCNPNSPSQPR